jgi:hypothetical protein
VSYLYAKSSTPQRLVEGFSASHFLTKSDICNIITIPLCHHFAITLSSFCLQNEKSEEMLIKIVRHTHCYHFPITLPSFCLQNEKVKK